MTHQTFRDNALRERAAGRDGGGCMALDLPFNSAHACTMPWGKGPRLASDVPPHGGVNQMRTPHEPETAAIAASRAIVRIGEVGMAYVTIYCILFATIGVPMLHAMERAQIRTWAGTRMAEQRKEISVAGARALVRARGKRG